MIVLDASAVVAILNGEPEREQLMPRLIREADKAISPMSRVEVVMALARKYADPVPTVEAFLERYSVALLPVDALQADWSVRAFLLFGKGRHPARLNLGDCFSYAAAKALNAPLLYIGNDFAKTDIKAA